jgi:hypothetical protein
MDHGRCFEFAPLSRRLPTARCIDGLGRALNAQMRRRGADGERILTRARVSGEYCPVGGATGRASDCSGSRIWKEGQNTRVVATSRRDHASPGVPRRPMSGGRASGVACLSLHDARDP